MKKKCNSSNACFEFVPRQIGERKKIRIQCDVRFKRSADRAVVAHRLQHFRNCRANSEEFGPRRTLFRRTLQRIECSRTTFRKARTRRALPGINGQISSAVKLKIGASQRTSASSIRYIALCALRRP